MMSFELISIYYTIYGLLLSRVYIHPEPNDRSEGLFP